jgi:hypothetical protein
MRMDYVVRAVVMLAASAILAVVLHFAVEAGKLSESVEYYARGVFAAVGASWVVGWMPWQVRRAQWD